MFGETHSSMLIRSLLDPLVNMAGKSNLKGLCSQLYVYSPPPMKWMSVCGCGDRALEDLGALFTRFQAKEVLSVLKGKRQISFGEKSWRSALIVCIVSYSGCLPSVLVKDLLLNPGIPEFGPESLEFTNDTRCRNQSIWPALSESSHPYITNHLIVFVFNCILIKWLANVHSALPNRLDSILASAVYSALFCLCLFCLCLLDFLCSQLYDVAWLQWYFHDHLSVPL